MSQTNTIIGLLYSVQSIRSAIAKEEILTMARTVAEMPVVDAHKKQYSIEL